MPIRERQARELTRIKGREALAKVWITAVGRARGKVPSSRLLAEVIEEMGATSGWCRTCPIRRIRGVIVECYLCGARDVRDDDPTPLDAEYACFGCDAVICQRHAADPTGSHGPEDHIDPEAEAGRPWLTGSE